jgi:cytoskeletal protein CcmA (bactofilin family)
MRVLLLVLGLQAAGVFAQPVVVERNVQVFGPSVRTGATVKGDFLAAGGRVVVDQAVADDALLPGGTVDLRARRLVLNGPVGGSVQAAVELLKIGPQAQVGGALRHPDANGEHDDHVGLLGQFKAAGRWRLARC